MNPANARLTNAHPEDPLTAPHLSIEEGAAVSHRIADLAGVFAADPIWEALMDEVRDRRRENAKEANEDVEILTETFAGRE